MSSFAEIPPLFASLGYAELPWYGNALIGLWLWCFGANVGSFMNVVVFRVPAGKSVVSPRSRCPQCGNAIRWFDNVPVLSWLWLRAKCRKCGVPISSRYPVVEAALALLFVVLAFLGPMTSGRNLPEVLIAPPLRLQTMQSLWLMYAYHLLLFCTLICLALIHYDKQQAPARLFLPALLVGILAPLVWPQLRPVSYAVPVHLDDRWIALLDGLAGIGVGVSLALITLVRDHRHKTALAEMLAAGTVGLFLGWQAAAALILSSEVAHLFTQRLAGRCGRIPRSGSLVVLAAVYIALWRHIDEAASWSSSQATMATFAISLLLVALFSWLSKGIGVPENQRVVDETKGNHFMPSNHDAATEAILNSHSYRLAERDTEFLCRPELRPVRLQLELLKPEMFLAEQGVHSTIVTFGGTQIVEQHEAEAQLEDARRALAEDPADARLERQVSRAERVLSKAKYYDAAREFGRLVSSTCQVDGNCDYVIVTGGGPGVMEAANRGAYDVGAKSVGLNITLPDEQAPNRYITPELCFQFHYFAIRKMHFLFRAGALVVFPGGFGTLDELFDALTLRQTNRMQEIPIILYGKEYWDRVVDFQFLADEGTIRDEHLDLIHYAETPQEAWQIIVDFHDPNARTS